MERGVERGGEKRVEGGTRGVGEEARRKEGEKEGGGRVLVGRRKRERGTGGEEERAFIPSDQVSDERRRPGENHPNALDT